MARQSKAVLCREWNKPVVVETITVESPKRGEVMVKIGACGVCQSDHSATNGTQAGRFVASCFWLEASGESAALTTTAISASDSPKARTNA